MPDRRCADRLRSGYRLGKGPRMQYGERLSPTGGGWRVRGFCATWGKRVTTLIAKTRLVR